MVVPLSPADVSTLHYTPFWQNFGQVWPVLISQFSRNAPPLPGTLPNPYGGYLPQSYWDSQQRVATYPAYSFALGADQENFRRNSSMIMGRFMATFGVTPTTEQMRTLQKLADYAAEYFPLGIEVFQGILANEAPNGIQGVNAKQILSFMQDTMDALNGPQGSLMPAYAQLRSQLGFMPLKQQGDFSSAYLHYINNNNDYLAGFTQKQAAAIQAFYYNQGVNSAAMGDTAIAEDVAKYLLSNKNINLTDETQPGNIVGSLSRYAEKVNGNKVSNLKKVGSFYQAAGKRIGQLEDAERKRALNTWDIIQQGISLSKRIKKYVNPIDVGILESSDELLATEHYLPKLDEQLDKLLADSSISETDKTSITALKKDISTYNAKLNEAGVMDTQGLYSDLRRGYRLEVARALMADNIAKTEEEARRLADIRLRAEQLSDYGLSASFLSSKVYNKDGTVKKNDDGTDRYQWQNEIEKKGLARHLKQEIKNLFESGDYELYTTTITEAAARDLKTTQENIVKKIEEYRNADTAKKADMEKNDKEYIAISKYLQQENLAGQAAQQGTYLNKAVSAVSEALMSTGSRLQTPEQAAQFLEMVSQGGSTYMGDEEYYRFGTRIAAGIANGMVTDNEVAQLSGWGHNAAAAAGADRRTGARVAVEMGLATAALVQKSGKMNKSLAMTMTAEAAGAAGHSLLTRTISAMYNRLIDMDPETITGPYADIKRKIRNRETLTVAERDLIERNSDEMLMAAGYNAQQLEEARNQVMTGIGEDYAVRQGAEQLLFTSDMRDVIDAGVTSSLANSFGLTTETLNKRLSSAQQQSLLEAFTKSYTTKNLSLLTDPSKKEEYKQLLLDRYKNNPAMQNLIKGMSAEQLQTAARHGLEGVAERMTGGDIQQAVTRIELGNGNVSNIAGMQDKQAAAVAAMGELPKNMMGEFVKMLTNNDSSIVNALQVLKTNVSENTDPELLESAFGSLAVQSIVVDKFKGSTGLEDDETAAAEEYLNKLYSFGGSTDEWMTIVDKVVSGTELTEKEAFLWNKNTKYRLKHDKETGKIIDEKYNNLLETINKAKAHIRKNFDDVQPLTALSKDPNAPPEKKDEEEKVKTLSKGAGGADGTEPISKPIDGNPAGDDGAGGGGGAGKTPSPTPGKPSGDGDLASISTTLRNIKEKLDLVINGQNQVKVIEETA